MGNEHSSDGYQKLEDENKKKKNSAWNEYSQYKKGYEPLREEKSYENKSFQKNEKKKVDKEKKVEKKDSKEKNLIEL